MVESRPFLGPRRNTRRSKMQENGSASLPPASAADLLKLLQEADGRLQLDDPPKRIRAAWRRAVYALINGEELPPGMCIRHSGRDQGDLIIRLVPIEEAPPAPPRPETIPIPETLRGCHPIIRATREAGAKDRSGIDNRSSAGLVHLRIQKSNLGRALLIVQGLINEAERRGYSIRAGQKSRECAGGLEIVINGHGFEVTIKEEQRQVEHVLTANQERDKDRGYYYGPRFDYEWTGSLQLRGGHDTYHAPLATDRKRWRLEERLPQALAKLEGMAAAAEERRQAHERHQAQEQEAWEAAMARAKVRFVEHFRSECLDGQIQAWQKAADIREFLEAARMAAKQDDQSWLSWIDAYASTLDPLGSPLDPGPAPEPDLKDLEPFLNGHSAYGPRSISRWF
jgi:hypothetical protein